MMESSHSSDQSARILAAFCDKFAAPVQGFAREELTTDQKDLLAKLANGELDERTRQALVPLLAKNEMAMEFLARAAS